jgi:hypothetical protein
MANAAHGTVHLCDGYDDASTSIAMVGVANLFQMRSCKQGVTDA